MASQQLINRLHGLLAVKVIRQQISRTNRLHISPPPQPPSGDDEDLKSNKVLRVNLSLMREQSIHANIPVSGIKLTLGLRVGFISSHLTADKPFLVNPKAYGKKDYYYNHNYYKLVDVVSGMPQGRFWAVIVPSIHFGALLHSGK